MLTEHKPVLRTLKGSPFRSLEEFFLKHGPPPQYFRIDASRYTTIVGARGLRLAIPPYSFSDIAGRRVEGPVDIQIQEIYTKAEMALANKATTSEDRILESAGQFWIQATQGAGVLQLLRPVAVHLPVGKNLRNPLAMRLFQGSAPTVKAYQADKYFDWRLGPAKPVSIKKANGRKYYFFQLEQLNWASCGYFISRSGHRPMVTLRIEGEWSTPMQQIAFLVFENMNAIARMYPGTHGFTALNIPNKISASAHVIGINDGQLYYGQSFISPGQGKLFHAGLSPVSGHELLETLNGI